MLIRTLPIKVLSFKYFESHSEFIVKNIEDPDKFLRISLKNDFTKYLEMLVKF